MAALKKMWIPLENNPETLTPLAHALGLSTELELHDVLSLADPDLLSFIPRPCLALIAIIPLTEKWEADREAEDKDRELYVSLSWLFQSHFSHSYFILSQILGFDSI
jgi:ubiquitin carboxyl-terminal hydrolase L3